MSPPVVRSGLPWSWRVTPEERTHAYRCSDWAAPGALRLVRGITVQADPATVWLWVAQLRRAPYSYDLVDNVGRRSPRTPDPTLLDLQPGQRVMHAFTLVDVIDGESMTIVPADGLPQRLFGALASTYRVAPHDTGSRLIGVLDVPPGRFFWSRWFRTIAAWGDLVMMRKQLRTLRDLAERP